MAIIIRSRKFVKYNGERSEELLELAVSSASELPEVDAIPGILISESSIAWDISTGDFYGLTGGTWYKQDGSGAAGAENNLQSNTAASPDRLIKQSVDLGTIEDDIIPNDIAESEDEPILSEEEQKDEVIEEPIVEKTEKKGKIAETKGDEDAVRNTENI